MRIDKLKFEYYPVNTLREKLRVEAMTLSAVLSRSVARATSVDDLPCVEYGDEVKSQQNTVQYLLYLQHCRSALERCIQSDNFLLKYKFADGQSTQTVFKMVGDDGVKVANLLKGVPAQN